MKNNNRYRSKIREMAIAAAFLAAFLAPLLAASCATTTTISAKGPSPVADASKWRLLWADEFEGTALDMNKWGYRNLGRRGEAVNVKDAVRLDGAGNLVLETRMRNGVIETAMIGTQTKFEKAFGYFECRARAQRTEGNWASFWLQAAFMGQFIGDPGRSGAEIDIAQIFRPGQDLVAQGLRWDGYSAYSHTAGSGEPGKVRVPRLSEDFHIFGLEWSAKGYVFYIDGIPTFRTDQGVSKVPEYIVLSLEVGPEEAKAVRSVHDFHDEFIIDYVRVYERIEDAK